MNKAFFLLFVFWAFFQFPANAGDIRAGNMRVEQLSNETVRVTVNLYTQFHAEPPQMELCWGDGNCEIWASTLAAEWPLIDTRHYQMQTFHGYQETGIVEISVESCCWTGDLANLSSAENIPFVMESTFLVSDGITSALNTMPMVNPYFAICSTDACGHQPVAEDLEGDSLVWSLCPPDVSIYFPLDEIAPSPNNQVSFDSESGNLTWVSPPFEGLYSHVTCLQEYRNGELISESQYLNLLVVANGLPTRNPEPFELMLSPNPVRDILYLKNRPDDSEPMLCEVYDAGGVLVFREEEIESINLSDWANGWYVLVFGNKKGKVLRSFFKQSMD